MKENNKNAEVISKEIGKENKSLIEQIIERIKKLAENKWILFFISLLPSFFSIIYKIRMAYKFKLPTKYFNINFIEFIEESFCLVLLLVLLIFYLFLKKKILKVLLLLLVIIFEALLFLQEESLQIIAISIFFCFLFLIFIKIEECSKKKRICKKIKISLKKLKETILSILKLRLCKFKLRLCKFLKKSKETLKEIKEKWVIRLLYTAVVSCSFGSLIEYILKKYYYYPFLMGKCIFFFILICAGILIFYLYDKETRKFDLKTKKSNLEVEKLDLENKCSLLDIIYILVFIFFVLLSIQTIITKVVPKEEKYEIFYEGKEPKVIITTYEGKYLIMDGYLNQKELTIYTEKYKLIDINKVEFIKYKNFNNVNVL